VQSQDKYATDVERATGQVLSGRLQQLIAPFFLRRTKDEVLAVLKQADQDDRQADRPLQDDDDVQIVNQPAASSALLKLSEVQKNDLIVWCKLNDAQLELYRNFLELPEVRDLLNSTRSPLAALTVLKKICDHVLLCSNIKLVEHNFDIVTNDLSHLCNSPHRTATESEIDELVDGSSKVGLVLSLLLQLKQQRQRTLIFSQSKIMLNIIASIMRARHITFRRIDGDVVKPADRQHLISEFNTDESIDCFLLTTQGTIFDAF
jgi:SNF2 family DNA or RNA helicase